MMKKKSKLITLLFWVMILLMGCGSSGIDSSTASASDVNDESDLPASESDDSENLHDNVATENNKSSETAGQTLKEWMKTIEWPAEGFTFAVWSDEDGGMLLEPKKMVNWNTFNGTLGMESSDADKVFDYTTGLAVENPDDIEGIEAYTLDVPYCKNRMFIAVLPTPLNDFDYSWGYGFDHNKQYDFCGEDDKGGIINYVCFTSNINLDYNTTKTLGFYPTYKSTHYYYQLNIIPNPDLSNDILGTEYKDVYEWANSLTGTTPYCTIYNDNTKNGEILEQDASYTLKDGDYVIVFDTMKAYTSQDSAYGNGYENWGWWIVHSNIVPSDYDTSIDTNGCKRVIPINNGEETTPESGSYPFNLKYWFNDGSEYELKFTLVVE